MKSCVLSWLPPFSGETDLELILFACKLIIIIVVRLACGNCLLLLFICFMYGLPCFYAVAFCLNDNVPSGMYFIIHVQYAFLGSFYVKYLFILLNILEDLRFLKCKQVLYMGTFLQDLVNSRMILLVLKNL